MRKIIITILALSISVFAFGGTTTKTYGTNASFGTSPNCSGRGICGTGVARSENNNAIPVTFSYNAGTKTFKITISKQVLADAGITDFNGDSYSFEQAWTTPGDMATALNAGNAFNVKEGQAGTITDDGANKIVTFTITP